MKDIKNYLHLYLGCECYDTFNDCVITLTPKGYAGYMEHWVKPDDGQIKPILRALSDITEEEKKEIFSNEDDETVIRASLGNLVFYPEEFKYLLSKHFDLFGLIDGGLAIDKTKM